MGNIERLLQQECYSELSRARERIAELVADQITTKRDYDELIALRDRVVDEKMERIAELEDELRKERGIGNGWCKECGNGYEAKLSEMAYDLAAMREQVRWTPVYGDDGKLPQKMTDVLIYYGAVSTGVLRDNGSGLHWYYASDTSRRVILNVTHWRPLPAPPTDEAQP